MHTTLGILRIFFPKIWAPPYPYTQKFDQNGHLLTKRRRIKNPWGLKGARPEWKQESTQLLPNLHHQAYSCSAWVAALDQLWVFSLFQRLEIIQEIGLSTSVFPASLSFSTYIFVLSWHGKTQWINKQEEKEWVENNKFPVSKIQD